MTVFATLASVSGRLDTSIVSAKGDLVVGSGAAAVNRLGVGSSGQILQADPTQVLGVKWATAPFAASNTALSVFAPEAYGAIGNGTVDDTVALQAAINAAGTAGGGVVRLSGKYLVSSTIALSRPNVLLEGAVPSFWNTAQSQFVVAPALNGSVITVTASGCSVVNIAFIPKTGSLSAATVTITGTRPSPVEGFVMRDVYATGLGGVTANYMERSKFDGVNLQDWNGVSGFSFTNCQLIFLRDCNSAAAGAGTTSSWIYDWYFSQCETIVMFNCEANNAPYYGFYMSATNDSKWYDVEFNGATQAQLYAVNCTDNQFVNPYCLGESTATPTGFSFYQCSVLMVEGAWVGDSTGSQVIFKSCNNVHLTDSTIFTNSLQNAIVLTDDGSMGNSDIVIADCNLNGDNGLGAAVTLGGTVGGDVIQISGCIVHAAGNVGSKGYVFNNPGLNMVTISGGSIHGVSAGFSILQAPNHLTLLSGINVGIDVTTPCSLPLPGMIKVIGCVNLPTSTNSVATNYTFQISDLETVVEGNSSSPLTFTLPLGVFPVGTILCVFQEGTGAITIAGASGVTLWAPNNNPSTTFRYQTLTLRQRDVNLWVVETPIPFQLQNPTQTANNYTFQLTDAGTVVEGNSSSPLTFTLPLGVFPVGTIIKVFQIGSGNITIAGASGVTLWGASGTSSPYAQVTLRQRGTNLWAVTTG